jgi:hypothetical protein
MLGIVHIFVAREMAARGLPQQADRRMATVPGGPVSTMSLAAANLEASLISTTARSSLT